MSGEVLIFLDPDTAVSGGERLRAEASQTAGDHLLIVPEATVAPDSGARVLRNRGDLAAVRALLSDQERLFAGAWLDRSGDEDARPGDGAAWDTPGFDPP